MAAPANEPHRERIYVHRDGLQFVVTVLDVPIGEDRFDDRAKALRFAELFAKAICAELIDNSAGLTQ
ncbi:hypothetical protein GCM10023208_23640 [Erythrobacter westpacificensis]|uniref:Uncharacterized protein n=1 Tax=Erythrobacter westpacificensis TaxID=1055231 RepID=A0ABP9KIT7_9SPHN